MRFYLVKAWLGGGEHVSVRRGSGQLLRYFICGEYLEGGRGSLWPRREENHCHPRPIFQALVVLRSVLPAPQRPVSTPGREQWWVLRSWVHGEAPTVPYAFIAQGGSFTFRSVVFH